MANVPDSKKVQTMINIMANAAQSCRDARDKMLAVRTKFQAINPDITGTPLEGNVAALNSALNALDAELNKAIWTGLIGAKVPSHEGKALD